MDKGIFAGLKVLDCASFIAAPAAATVLSDFGADVIKIEPPGAGDPYRNLPNLPGYPTGEHNFAWHCSALRQTGIPSLKKRTPVSMESWVPKRAKCCAKAYYRVLNCSVRGRISSARSSRLLIAR